jgi:hypothetical protein
MLSFDGERLFESGPSRLTIGGVALRQATAPALASDGVRIAGQGLESRPITQHGTLTADTRYALRKQCQTIEAKVDGQAHSLVDRFGQSWQQVMMLRFEPGPMKRLGPRWRLDYRIAYEQLLP